MSKVEVNQVTQQCGTTLTVGGGACKTAVVDATTVTLGRCGGTVSLASGATQSGFGRTGTVDWDTSIKTGTVTAVTGNGYFVDTTSGAITVNLPAAAVGSIVAVSDYASTSVSNNITITPNGSEKINGVNADYVIETAGLAVTLVYADATRGWKSVTGSDADATGVPNIYIAATGGNQPTASGCIVDTNYKIHKFTGPGTFCVSAASGPRGVADYIVVAGGGSGGTRYGGGGGGGGFRESHVELTSGPYTASPLAAGTSLPISPGPYAITVGGGGAGVSCTGYDGGVNGSNSIFSTITSTGGGGGSGQPPSTVGSGGSGGGASYTPGPSYFGAGNTPITTPSQGFPGGDGGAGSVPPFASGGGGGATVAGTTGLNVPVPPGDSGQSGPGGDGATTSISGSPVAYAGGGGGGKTNAGAEQGAGGAGGGGMGGQYPGGTSLAAPANQGGGSGGGFGIPGSSGAAGSGIIYIRYKFQ